MEEREAGGKSRFLHCCAWWGSGAKTGVMTTVQRVPVMVVAAMVAAASVTAVVAQGLGAAGSGEVANGEVAVQLKLAGEMVAKGDAAGAEKALRAAVVADRTMGSKRALADFLMNRPMTGELAAEVVRLLGDLSEDQTKAGAEALTVGLMRRLIPPAEVDGWMGRLRSHPGVTPLMLVAVDRIEMGMKPGERGEIAARAVKRLEGAAVGDREDGVRMLTEMGEFKLALPLLSREEAVVDEGKLGAWSAVRIGLEEWGEILEVMAMPGLPVAESMQKLLKGRALIGTGKVEEGRALCREACRDGKVKPEERAGLFALLASLREPELFEEELRLVLGDAGAAGLVMKAVVPVLRRSRDARVMHHLYELAAGSAVLGKDAEVQAKRSHYGLMLGKRESLTELEERLNAAPLAAWPRVTYVLGLLQEGKGEQALRELQIRKPLLEESKMDPSQIAVVAGVFAATGHGPDAAAVAGRLPVPALTVQEAEWLGGRLEKAGLLQVPGAEGAGVAEAEPRATGWQRSVARYGFDLLLVAGAYGLWVIWQKFIRKSA